MKGEVIFGMNKNNSRKASKNDSNKLASIVCDYDSYQLVGEADETNPQIFERINAIISSGEVNIKEIPIYNELRTEGNQEDFDFFYDEWIKFLHKRNYLCYLDNKMAIEDFVSNINIVLKSKAYPEIDAAKAIGIYYQELEKKEVFSKINFDILIANTVASMLRESNVELICLFDGFRRSGFAVIEAESITELKSLEAIIK